MFHCILIGSCHIMSLSQKEKKKTAIIHALIWILLFTFISKILLGFDKSRAVILVCILFFERARGAKGSPPVFKGMSQNSH